MENALWGADKVASNEEPINHAFVTAFVKGDTGPKPGHWAIKGGDAQAGALKSYWDGNRAPGYAPMKKQVCHSMRHPPPFPPLFPPLPASRRYHPGASASMRPPPPPSRYSMRSTLCADQIDRYAMHAGGDHSRYWR